MKEEWRQIADSVYEISERGVVRRLVASKNGSFPAGYVLKPAITDKGYYRVWLTLNGKVRPKFVHDLVALAFVGPRPEGKQVNHKDGNKGNLFWKNLEWITPKQNIAHAIRTGLRDTTGEANGNSKLTAEDVKVIRKIGSRISPSKLGRRFGVNRGMIWSILTGRHWKRVI